MEGPHCKLRVDDKSTLNGQVTARDCAECLTISSDEEMDVECQEEVPRVITNHHVTTTTATRENSVVLYKDVHCPLVSEATKDVHPPPAESTNTLACLFGKEASNHRKR